MHRPTVDLLSIFKQMENYSGVNFLSFPEIVPFGSQCIFDVSASINPNDSGTWISIDPVTRRITDGIHFTPGSGMCWGSIVFHLSNTQVVAIDAEFDFGLEFRVSEKLGSKNPEDYLKDFYYSTDWEKHAQDGAEDYYIDQWIELSENRSNFRRLEK